MLNLSFHKINQCSTEPKAVKCRLCWSTCSRRRVTLVFNSSTSMTMVAELSGGAASCGADPCEMDPGPALESSNLSRKASEILL